MCFKKTQYTQSNHVVEIHFTLCLLRFFEIQHITACHMKIQRNFQTQ